MPNAAVRDATARGWGRVDDLSNGAWLQPYSPFNNGPSDFDSEPWHHVLHNKHITPHRQATVEYKPPDAELSAGQRILFEDRPGFFTRKEDNMQIVHRIWRVHYTGERLVVAFELMLKDKAWVWERVQAGSADDLARVICGWVWPTPRVSLGSVSPNKFT